MRRFHLKTDFKKLAKSILIPLLLGALVGFLTSPGKNYKSMVTPAFAPPGILFPIVWSILYILMGISSYRISERDGLFNGQALKIYNIQLAVNLLWSFLFFTFRWYFLAFLWIILLIVLVIKMIKKFSSIDRLSAYIQIPYLLWITFAAILNFAVYTLN